jgi:hypothetical protein
MEDYEKGGFVNWKGFEKIAREVMSKHFGVNLTEKELKNSPKKKLKDFPKKFDMVSPNEDVVGDAKFLTLVKKKKAPPAKFMDIAGHVWLLGKTRANKKFLVFGHQRKVPDWWLKKYGQLVDDVEFYFIDSKRNVKRLK